MIGTPAEHQKALIDRLQGENAELRDDLMGAVERALGSEALANWRRDKIEELTDIIDSCEAANAKHLSRIDHLEAIYWKMWRENEELKQLCLDMYKVYCQGTDWARFHDRFISLGLIGGKTIEEMKEEMKAGEQA